MDLEKMDLEKIKQEKNGELYVKSGKKNKKNKTLISQISGLVAASGGSDSQESASNAGDQGSIPGLGRCLEEDIATHSSILAWRISWTQEPGGLQSTGSQS